jgi:methylenetetrahydrofolate reductase (NADPH)
MTAAAPQVSFEFFPPKNDEMEARLWDSVERLSPLGPDFVSVTYGAGGSTRSRTQAVVRRMIEEKGLHAAGHITCVAASRAEVDSVLSGYWDAGVRRIVALRGDPLEGIGARYCPHPSGYAYASDLIAGALRLQPFDITVGCYPETHPEAGSMSAEIDNLRRKVDAGAARAITQFFFEPATYFRYIDAVRAAGIVTEIIPGIMLQSNFRGLRKMAAMCGASIPGRIADLYDGLDADPETRDLVTAHIAADLCNRLAEQGVNRFHFYTMNRSVLSLSTCRLLGVRPQGVSQ